MQPRELVAKWREKSSATRLDIVAAMDGEGSLDDVEFREGRADQLDDCASDLEAALAEQDGGWVKIEDIPETWKDGRLVDLWIVGADDTVDFYAPGARKLPREPKRHGRVPDFRWHHRPPNKPNWYPAGGLTGYPLSPDVTVTHARLVTPPPCAREGDDG